MKSFLTIALLVCSLPLFAAEGEKGIGLMIGNPTGVNGKFWLDDSKAIDAGIGASLGRHTDASIHSDYLLHSADALFLNDTVPLDLYYGLGARMEFADSIELGVRVPVGVVHRLKAESADLFTEIAPIIDIVGRMGLELHFIAGARYYF